MPGVVGGYTVRTLVVVCDHAPGTVGVTVPTVTVYCHCVPTVTVY